MEYKQFTKINKTIISFGIVIAIIILIWVIFLATPSASATSSDGWQVLLTGTIIDIDPVYCQTSSDGYWGLFFELDDGEWIWLWKKNMEGEYPNRFQKGSFYKKKVGKINKYKWVVDKSSPKIVKKVILKAIPKSNNWKMIAINIPPTNKTVLVKYANGKIITTAYINDKGEWKLETDRKKVLGGRIIKTIKKWKDIPR